MNRQTTRNKTRAPAPTPGNRPIQTFSRNPLRHTRRAKCRKSINTPDAFSIQHDSELVFPLHTEPGRTSADACREALLPFLLPPPPRRSANPHMYYNTRARSRRKSILLRDYLPETMRGPRGLEHVGIYVKRSIINNCPRGGPFARRGIAGK